jgi:hypothetical protein
VYAKGTVSAAGTLFLPIGQIGTSALTAEISDDNLIHLGGAITVPPGYFAAVSCDATMTSGVIDVGLVWMEMPND